MKFFKYLVPNFLRKIDAYLLQRYPIIWETKIVFVLFYSLIVANALLWSLGMVVPISRQYVPQYDSFRINTLIWSSILAVLAIGYYAYQQSFIRIKVYTVRENVLRYGIYVVAVSSILSNILVFPNTVISRVRALYTAEEVKNDCVAIRKTEILKEFVLMLFNANVEEKEKILAKLKSSAVNAQGEVDDLYKSYEMLDKLVRSNGDFWGNVEKQTLWNEALKAQIIAVNGNNSGGSMGDFAFCAFELATKPIQAIYAKYPNEVVKNRYEGYRYYQNEQVYKNIQNVEEYLRANVFLVTRHDGRAYYENHEYYPRSKKTRAQEAYTNLFDNIFALEKTYTNSKILEEWYNLKTNPTSLLDGGRINQHSPEVFYTAMPYITNTKRVHDLTSASVGKMEVSSLTLYAPYGVFMLLVSLFVLVTKALSMRNVFIAAIALIVTMFATGFTMMGIALYIPNLGSYFILNDRIYPGHYNELMQGMWVGGHFMLGILAVVGTFGAYILRNRIHKKWFETVWVYFLGGSFLMSFAWFMIGYENILRNHTHYSSDFVIYLGIYGVFAVAIFAMYCAYNKMIGLPTKR